MNFKKILKSPFAIFLILNTLFLLLTIIFTPIALDVYANTTPFPERYTISEMTPEMIAMGQDTSLIKIYTFISIALFCILMYIITSCGLLCNLFSFYELKQMKNNEVVSRNGLLKIILNLLFCISYFFLSIVIIWYIWFIFLKENTNLFCKNSLILNRIRLTSKIKIITWLSFILLIPISLLSLSTGIILNINKNSLSYLIPKENVDKYLKLSNNKQNIIYLYFDRTQGVTWNLLLQIDKIINKDKSFINLFPEFTSYCNTISTSTLTKISTPSLYGGPKFNVAAKQTKYKNLSIQPKTNDKLNENEWILYTLYNLANMLNFYDTKNITYNNLPYYGDSSMSIEWHFGNMYRLQKDLKNIGMDVNTMTNAKIANDILNSYVKLFDTDSIYDAQVLNALPKLISFDKTNSGTFFSFFSQQTHENYIVKQNSKYKEVKGPDHFIHSIWTVIQDLKPFLLRLKAEPFVDENNNILFDKNNNMISVYDKSMIYIVSDHGYEVRKLNIFKDICNYLRGRKILSEKNYQSIFNFNYHNFIPILNIKKSKYDVNNNLINNQEEFIFNDDQVLCLSDLFTIIENNLIEYLNGKFNSILLTNNNLNKSNNVDAVVSNQTLSNPLDVNFNSLKNKKLINRKFSLTSTYDWRMYFNSTTFEIKDKYEWDIKNINDGFWNNNNLIKLISKTY